MWPRNCTGSPLGRKYWIGNRPTPNGSSAARPTSPTTASTATASPIARTRSRFFGKASPAISDRPSTDERRAYDSIAPVAIIEALETLAGPFGIGRGIHLGDTVIGTKGRVAFEAPAAEVLLTAHRELEKLVLTKLGEPKPVSGRQEYLENLLNTYLHG